MPKLNKFTNLFLQCAKKWKENFSGHKNGVCINSKQACGIIRVAAVQEQTVQTEIINSKLNYYLYQQLFSKNSIFY